MAAESPRPGSEEDAEEEGEEAAEALVKVVTEKEEIATPDSPPPPGEDDEAAPPSKSPETPPAVPAEPAYPRGMALYRPVSPAYSSAVHPSVSGVNLFANDGSFLELFKKKMEASSAGSKEETKEPEEKPEPDKKKPVSFVGKRRGGAKLALKTGIVTKKPKTDEEEIMTHKGGAWAQYMAEVKKYKAHQCSDDDKTRPLVK